MPFNPEGGDWQTTHAGRPYSHKFGYGTLTARTLIDAAQRYVNVNPQTHIDIPFVSLTMPIPNTVPSTVKVSFQVTKDMVESAHFYRLEHITVTVDIQCERRGDIYVSLISPHKVESNLIQGRSGDFGVDISRWTMSTVAHWYPPHS